MKTIFNVIQEFQAAAVAAGLQVASSEDRDGDLEFWLMDVTEQWLISVRSETNIYKDGHRIYAQCGMYPGTPGQTPDPLRPMTWLQSGDSCYVWNLDIYGRASANSPSFSKYIERARAAVISRLQANEQTIADNIYLHRLCQKYGEPSDTDIAARIVTPYGHGQIGLAKRVDADAPPRGVLRLNVTLPEQHIDAVLSLLNTLSSQDDAERNPSPVSPSMNP